MSEEKPVGDQLDSIEDAIEEIRRGRMVVLVDDEDRENEGDLVVAAEMVSKETINFMATHARGLICLALSPERVERLGLRQMVMQNTSPYGTAFTVSIDAATGITTGLSAADRARTIQVAIDDRSGPRELVTPGHIFPLRAQPGGVLIRSGQTEGSVDLARLAGLRRAAVICEILNDDGTMSRLPELFAFRQRHGIKIVSVAELIRYRVQHETLIERIAESQLPTTHGAFMLTVYQNRLTERKHVVLRLGEFGVDEPVLVRVHRQEMVADLFGRFGATTGDKLGASLELIAAEGKGLVLYIQSDEPLEPAVVGQIPERQRRRYDPGIEKIRPFYDFGVGAQILRDQGLRKLRVISNNHRAFRGLSGFGLEIVEWVALPEDANENAGSES
ncbi:MAG: 3,4-dihydroxy-2-butanone-4-phosphate synthase [Myxococcales bacterium]|nr:3,4-dihydroxy-2-butanone-4-phosphate synthase [Myxococcales bacterium]